MIRQLNDFDNYWVTETGKVYSAKRPKGGGRFLLPKIDRYGYESVTLRKGGRKGTKKSATVHRLIASAFIPNPEDKPTVNHKDGDKTNNHVSNLEWATCGENTRHAWANGLCTPYDRTQPYNRQGIIDSNKKRCGI